MQTKRFQPRALLVLVAAVLFALLVVTARTVPHSYADDALVLADGRIYSGRQALDAKLIDEIGGEEEALDWLASKGVKRSLPVKDWEPANSGSGLFSTADIATLWLLRQLGIAPTAAPVGLVDRVLPQRLMLDGLVSVWQAPGSGSDGPAKGALQ